MKYRNLKVEQRDDGLWSASVEVLTTRDWWELFSIFPEKEEAEQRILSYLRGKNATEKTES